MSNNVIFPQNATTPEDPMINLALRGIIIGDAFGAGWEMKSQEYILEHWDEMLVGFRDRDPGHNENHKPGMYTDDFEMSLGVLLALMKERRLTKDLLIQAFIHVYQTNAAKNGGRCGYGSFVKVIKKMNAGEDWQAQVLANRSSQAGKTPGNADLIRLAPCYLMAATDEDAYYNAMINSLSTHPHPVAVFTSFAMVRAARFMANSGADPNDLIEDIIANVPKIFEQMLPTLLQDEHFMKDQDKINTEVSRILKNLSVIAHIPPLAEGDVKLEGLSSDNRFLISGPYAKPLGGQTGLSAKDEQSFYCTMFLLRNIRSTDAFGTLLRCMAIGGDTDSLAAIVMPIVLPFFGEEGLKSFPEWVLRNLETPLPELITIR